MYFRYPTCSPEPNGVTEELKERRLEKNIYNVDEKTKGYQA